MEEQSILSQLKDVIRHTEIAKKAVESKRDKSSSSWKDSEQFIASFSDLLNGLLNLTSLPEDAAYTSEKKREDDAFSEDQVSINLSEVPVPIEYLDVVDKTDGLNDPRLLLAFKKKTSLEEVERNNRYGMNFKTISNEIKSFLETTEDN